MKAKALSLDMIDDSRGLVARFGAAATAFAHAREIECFWYSDEAGEKFWHERMEELSRDRH